MVTRHMKMKASTLLITKIEKKSRMRLRYLFALFSRFLTISPSFHSQTGPSHSWTHRHVNERIESRRTGALFRG